MARVLTITLNPTIDVFGEARKVEATHKTRLTEARYEPGGGGINVARVISALGGDVLACFLSGGEMGAFLSRLLADEGIPHQAIAMAGQTRVALMVHDQSTGLEYRFLPEGPMVAASDIEACAKVLEDSNGSFLVASGSLPRGAPVDSYTRLAKAAAAQNMKFVLDSSGEGLRSAVATGGIYLAKPSRSELEHLAGKKLDEDGAAAAARELVVSGKVKIVALTLGAEGAMLVSGNGTLRLPAIPVPVRSAVGAGDGFLGAMVWALSENWPLEEAFRLGMAAGAAATMNTSTVLCRKSDVLDLYLKTGGTRPL